MPFEFDDERKSSAGSFVFDDEQPGSKKKKKEGKSASEMLVDGLKTAKDYGLAIAAGAGAGVADLEAAAGTFIQAPVENLRSGMTGAAALVDRGVTNAANWVSPGSAQVNQALQETAQDQSAQATAAREANVRGTPGRTVDYTRDIARMGLSLQDDGRGRSQSIQDFNQENNPELVRQQREVAQADGFVDTAKAVLTNPLALTNSLAQSAPGMAAGAGMAAKAAQVAGGSAKVAGVVGAGSEGGMAAMQARESVYQQVASMPVDKLAQGSPRFNEILAQVGNPEKARNALANELADQAPVLVGAGTVAGSWLTNKLFGGDKSAEILAGGRMSAKDIPRNFAQEGIEEVAQGVPEDLTNYTALSQADKDTKLDLGGGAASNFLAGGILGGGGSAGAYVGQKYRDFRTGNPGDETPPAPNVKPSDQGGAPVNASEILGAPTAPKSAPVPSGTVGTSDTSAAVEALKAAPTDPLKLTNLSRMEQVDQKLAELPEDAPERAMLLQDRAALTKDFPVAVPGNAASFSTESGVKLEGQYALMDAGSLITSHDENLRVNPRFPQELQPRERDRAASELQISGIVQRLDPARLGVSADAATGAPIVGADGLVESGNARTIALKRIYQANGQKAADYKQFLADNAAQFGITPESVHGMEKPVLVRVRSTPVNRAEFARQANASTVAQMSPSEQAKSDAARIDVLEDLNPDDNGDFSTSRDFIRRFVAKLPATEQGAMLDANGALSSTGYTRVRNAVLAKAYGDSPVLARMVESMDDNLRNISKALMTAAPKVAQVRQAIAQGNRFDADITPDLVAAVEELSRLKDSGTSVADALAQAGMFGDQYSEETKQLLQFLADNIRRPRRMADFIVAYMDALDAAGDPNQGSLLGDVQAPGKGELLTSVKKGLENDGTQNNEAGAQKDAQRGNSGEGTPAGEQGAGQPADAPGGGRSDQGNGPAGSGRQAQGVKTSLSDGEDKAQTALSVRKQLSKTEQNDNESTSEWVDFPRESGTVGIPRADMPQIKGEDRGALIQFLKARGIAHSTQEMQAGDLKPTQAEFSTKKAARWGEVRDGVDRSVLVSSDGHILDGHHQWVAALAVNEPVKAIVLDAPIRELMTNVFQFPSVKRSEGFTEQAAGKQARQDFKAAMADLADLLLDSFGGRAMMVPGNTPKLRETLVKLFSAAIEIVGTDLKAATKWVKEQLKANADTKRIWNKITDKEYQAAALEAMEQSAKDRVDDLFSKAEKRQASLFDDMPAAPAVAKIDGRAYDMKRDNFKAPETDTFIPADVLANARGQIGRLLKSAAPVEISAQDREKAEKLLKPLIERANEAKAEYDQKIIDIAKRTGALGQMLAPVKGLARSVEKLVTDEGVNFDPGKMYDMLRSTIVVSRYADAQAVVDAIRKEFEILPKRIKDQSDAGINAAEVSGKAGFLGSGYGQVLVNVRTANGTTAEIQINVPEMLAVKNAEGHKLYEIERAEPEGSETQANAIAAQREIYPLAASAAAARAAATTSAGLPAASRKPASVNSDQRKGHQAVGDMPSQGDFSSSTKRLPSGNSTYTNSTPSSSVKSMPNSQPGGNLSGTFISTPLDFNVAEKSIKGYATENLFGDSDVDTTGGQGRIEGESSTAAQRTGGQRKAGGTRSVSGRPSAGADSANDNAGSQDAPVGQAAAGGARSKNEDGRSPQSGDSAKSAPGVPAGPDIPTKSGRNYGFGPDDLTYEGSWPKKAEQNVEAVELLKRLQAEGRQATREEQQALAKFIGWGSSELANNLFGSKLDKSATAMVEYADSIAAMEKLGRDYLQKGGQYRGQYADNGYYQAVSMLRNMGKIAPQEYPQRVTRADLDAAKPKADVTRWLSLRDRLKAALTKDEWADAARSTQYAHYTSKGVVTSMWKAMTRMGFNGGHILEPGAGIGVFAGLMPQATALNSSYTGIEFDAITGGILQQLFPDERILVESFIDTKLPKNFYDVAIGNPPFSGTKILSDPEYAKMAMSLHDYFFAKSIDRVKPGGLVMYVTSRYTMDKLDDKARKYLSDRADLVGAIRLPQTAFKQNAGTDVVTDVLFLRKKVAGETFEHAQAWSKSVPLKVGAKEFPVNEYFHAHPEMVLGTPSDTGKMQNSNEPQYTVLAPTQDIETLFDKAVEGLPADIYQAQRGSSAEAAKVREIDFNPKAKKEGNYYVTDAGVLMQRESGVGQRVELRSPKDVELVKAFVPLRDALKQAHYDQLNDGDWEASLKALQKEYAAFTKKHGQINQFTSKTVKVKVDELDEDGTPTGRKVDDEEVRRAFPLLEKLVDDPDWTLVQALENLNEDTGEISASNFLSTRVLGKPQAAEAATPVDALLTTLNDVGRVDIPTIAARVGLTEAETIEALGSSVYDDPEQGWVTADDYLSGNVKRKLELARTAAKNDRRFERNVLALEANQPEPLTPSQIDPRLGMNWIPGEVYQDFISDITSGQVKVTVEWNPRTKNWNIEAVRGHKSDAATNDWGTLRRNVVDLLDNAVTGRPVRIESSDSDGKKYFDAAETEAANEKLKALHDKFASWVFSEPNRTDMLVRRYNDTFNTTVPRSFDGSHLNLPGSSKQFSVFDHVKRGAWRIIQSGNTYLAHAVGSGKTFQMVISAMEQKRLGLIKKPMVVVPNHMLKQFSHEWQQLYPAARLMVADEHNFHTDNRRRFVSRVALSDLDGVVITHSAFKLLDLDPEFKTKMIEEQLEYMRAALEEAGGDPDKLRFDEVTDAKTGKVKLKARGSGNQDPKVKRIEKQLENLEQKLLEATSSEGKDQNVRFDELGVDFLYVDEAHEYRKLDFATSRQVKGISPMGSARAFDLFMKARYLESKTPGRSLVLASGTPVTNTVAELYTVQKMLGYQELVDKGIEDFDSWASMFGREKTALEPNAAGKYELVTRFQDFANVPELTQMFREFADVLTSDHLAEMLGDKRPKVEGGSRSIIVTPETSDYEDFRSELEARMEASKAWKPSKDEPNNPDPVIRIIGDGRLAAIDMRFMDPKLPSDPDSKLNRMIDDVIVALKETADYEYKNKAGEVEPTKGASAMVFSDLGFGAGVTESRGFNARAWFEKRLRDAGIPMNQVAFMSDYKKSSAKLKLFSDLNAGRVRLLIGSSKNMGTGVNAQQRLKHLFHLDSPWYPADLEQREGRIVRQGNKNPLVRIKAYAAKGTYDQQMWGQLANKQMFIDKAMSGDPSVRKIEDAGSADLMAMVSGMVAKDPRVLELAGLNADIAKMQRLYQAHEDARSTYRGRFNDARSTAEWNEARLPEAEKVAGKAQDLSGDKFRAKVGSTTLTERAAWAEALIAKYKDLSTRGEEQTQTVGEISGFKVAYTGEKVGGQFRAYLMLEAPSPVLLVSDVGTSPVGVAMRAQNTVVDIGRAPAKMRERISEARAQMDGLSTKMNAPFPMAGMLADKVRERDALMASMAAEGKPKPEDGEAPEGISLSRGAAGGGMDFDALTTVVNRIKARMPNLPKVHVLRGPAEAPMALKLYIQKQGAWDDVEGAIHNGELYMFASGLSGALRAEHVLAEHEAAHFGLRGLLGKDRTKVMNSIWVQNAEVRKAAAKLQAQGRLSNAEATEEVLVDIPTAQLARLKGWRALVMKVRDFLADRGFEAMAEKLTRFLSGTLGYQQRADMMVADLVRAARAYAAGNTRVRGSVMDTTTALSDGMKSLAEDAAKQEKWLNSEAQARGYADIDALAEQNYPLFEKLAVLWRQRNPAETLLSRRPETKAAYEKRIDELFSGSKANTVGAKVLDRTELLGLLGYADRPVFLQESKVLQNRTNHPEMSASIWKKIPGWIDNPSAVFDSATMPGRLVMIAPELVDGNIVMMVIEPDAKVDRRLNVHLMVNAYSKDQGKPPIAAWARDGLTRYVNQKEFPAVLSRSGLQLPSTAFQNRPGTGKILTEKNLAGYIKANPETDMSQPGNGSLLSRAPAKVDPEQRAETIIQTKAASRAPVDMMARMLTKVTGTEKILGAVYSRAATLLDRYTPENIKAGIVSDYGVPEAVIDKRSTMQGNQRKQLRAAGSLLEKLATLTREESRVAYEWMNMDGSDPRAYMSMLQGLPEESVKVLTEVQQLIDQLSQEAMRLGQLSPEAYKANRFAYLRRSYVKHTAELTTGEAKKRARAITVLGDQYKGRGMTDAANMTQIQNLAPEWWKRKLQAGKADASLKGEKFVRLERRAPSGEGVKPLEGMTGKPVGKLLEIAYYPAGEKLPAKYQEWNQAGEWTVRDVKGGNLVMWRDFTKAERETMGEIDEARFAIAKTLHGMINDVEVGRYLEWLGHTYAKQEGESIPGTVVEASERMRDTFKPGDWVKVPETKISGTNVFRYGKLAGRYLPGPIWNDLRQVVNGQFMPLGETYANLLRLWKTSKTALSPAVHTNNIMSNFVMADWHDVTAGHMAKALRILLAASKGTDRAGMGGAALRAASTLGRADVEASKAIVARYQDSGGDIGGWATQEIRDEQLKPLLDALEKELAATAGQSVQAQVGVYSALQHALMLRLPSAFAALKGGKVSGKVVGAVSTEAGNLIDLYQSEDDVFRLAAWLKAKEEGRTDLEAGKSSRESFLDYRVNAPWIQAMRQTGWPFISFTYRAVPMFLETAAKKPHKLMKLMLLAGGLNALGVFLSGGDDDKERKLLPEEKAGRIWGMVPKLIRMPWNDQHGSAVYLDIRRFIPVGDVFDVGAGHSAVPMLPGLTPGGPLVLAGELVLNKSAFTGKSITLETDTGAQQAGKVVDYLYKAFAPNLLGLPNTYATQGVVDAANGRTDAFGREMSVTQAMASSFGVKLGSYPVDVLRRNAKAAADAQISEIDKNIAQLKRQRQTSRITAEDFQSQVTSEQEKKRKVMEDLAKKM